MSNNSLAKEIRRFMDDYKYESTVIKGRSFLNWVLENILNRTPEELNLNDLDGGVLFTDGTNDKGIDAAFLDGETLFLVQTKYGSSHNKDSVQAFKTKIEEFISKKDGREMNSSIAKVHNKMLGEEVVKVNIYYLTDNDLTIEKERYNYNSYINDIQNKAPKEKKYSFVISGVEKMKSITMSMLQELPKQIKNREVRFVFANSFSNRDKNTIVGEMPIKNLASIVKENDDFIFHSNIRNFLGKNKINKGIAKTFNEQPKNFWFYNNGITIVCSDFKRNSMVENQFVVTGPQIVNGCQTSTTIMNEYIRLSQIEQNNLEGTILVKIIKDPSKEKRNFITQYTNSQTSVTGKDFFALESFHKYLQKQFNTIGYDYEIQRNRRIYNKKAFLGKDEYNHLFDSKFKKNNSFVAKEITQYYVAAFHQKPASAKNLGNFMPGGNQYDSIFNDNSPEDPRFYIFPYAVYYTLKNRRPIPRRIDSNKWNASLLFTTSIFFRSIKLQLEENGEKASYISDEYMDNLNKIMIDKQEFFKRIDYVLDIIDDFYNDSTVIRKIGDNLPKFLKSTIDSDVEIKHILAQKMRSVLL